MLIDFFDSPNACANSAINAVLALPRSGAVVRRTFKHSSCQPLIALCAAPAATLTTMRVLVTSAMSVIAPGLASNNPVELIGEGLAIAMVEWRLAAGIDTAAAQRVHQVANR
jgi:hypothetical protein